MVEQVKQNPQLPIRLGIVGGGAGGVELALAVQGHLHQILQQDEQFDDVAVEIHLFQRDAKLMPHYNSWVRRRCQDVLIQKGIKLHLQETVCEIQPNYPILVGASVLDTTSQQQRLNSPLLIKCESGSKIECDRVFWVTQASAPIWLKAAGLATDEQGFIQVHDTLQSISHPDVFAAGDIASMVNHPRPKAGVFAVRQGKPCLAT